MTSAAARRFSIQSFGCQMNAYDAERMAETLTATGLAPAAAGEPADVVVLHTCHIREKATEKLFSEVGRIRRDARAGAEGGRNAPTIVVAGCVAQAEGAEIARRAPAVDIVVGPQAYHRLPDLLRTRAETGRLVVDLDLSVEAKFDHLPLRARRSASAFLTVQEGCDKFCTFCVVPYTRGAEASRPLAAILAEAERLVAGGAIELTLLGQNVNAWADPEDPAADFAVLLRAVAAVPGVERLRYTTSHPRDVTEAMIRAHADIPQLMPYLHLPVQSGSDRVLKAMNRRHDRAFYLDLVQRLRAVRPDLALSSDFIVGFPGETEADFEDTLALIEAVGFAQAFSFKYSPRIGTPAAEAADQIADTVQSARLARLQQLLQTQAQAFNARLSGRQARILVERPGRRPGQWIGRAPWGQSVVVEGALSAGMLVDVELGRAGPNSQEGRIVSADQIW
jgi:tRNA-2-methylthio-N6-dimethylallyladenosine synthase